MLLFCALAKQQGVEVVIESGRRFGYSTEVLARHGWRVLSVDCAPVPAVEDRLNYPNLSLLVGDGTERVPNLLNGRRTAVLLDGPKGITALRLLDSILDRIVIGAIHDCYRGVEVRRELEQRGGVFSDAPEFVAEFGDLDAEMLAYRGMTHGTLSESNVIGVLRGGLWR